MFRSRGFTKFCLCRALRGNAAGRRRNRGPVRLMLESLEDRLTPAAPTAILSSAVALNYNGISPSPAFSIPVAVNATTGGTASGGTVTIDLVSGNTTTALGSATLGSNGTATVSVASGALPANLQAGTYQLIENYAGNTIFDPSNALGTLSVKANGTSIIAGNTAINFGSSNPFSISVGVNTSNGPVNSGSVTINLISGTTSTTLGTATVSSDGTAKVDVTNAGVLTTLSALPPSNYQLVETYTGAAGGQFSGSTATGTLTINAAPTTVVVGNTNVNYGNTKPFTISVGVNSAIGTVDTGVVSIDLVSDNTVTPLGSAAMGSNGTATVSVTNPVALATIGTLSPGKYQLVETFTDLPGGQFGGSTTNGTLTINAVPTTLVLTNPSVTLGTTSPFTIPVVVQSPGGLVPGGTVTFDLVNGSTTIPLGTATVGPNGTATLTVTGVPLSEIATLPYGQYQLVETFSTTPGGPFATTSSVGTLTIAATTMPSTIIIPGNAIVGPTGGTTTIPVTVNSPAGSVNFGTVTISLVNGSKTPMFLGSAAVSNGTANVQVTIPAGMQPGTYTLVETYSDTTGHFGGSSNNGTLTVQPPSVAMAALEVAIDAAAIPSLTNPGAMSELQLFSEVFLHQPVPTSVPQLIADIQSLFPYLDGLGFPAIAAGMWLAQDLAIENPQP